MLFDFPVVHVVNPCNHHFVMAGVNNRGNVWSNAEVDALIDVWKAEDIEAQLEGVHRNLPVYARVSELLRQRGFERSAEQCRTKMKHLKTDYMKDKNINGRSGHSRLDTRLFDKLDDILGHRPIATPAHVVDAAAFGIGLGLNRDRGQGGRAAEARDIEMFDEEPDDPPDDQGRDDDIDLWDESTSRPRPIGTGNDSKTEDELDSLTPRPGTSMSAHSSDDSRKTVINDFANKKSRKRKQSSEGVDVVGSLQHFLAKQEEAQEKMLKHEEMQFKAQLEAERQAREQEFRQNMEFMRMMMTAITNPQGSGNQTVPYPLMPTPRYQDNQSLTIPPGPMTIPMQSSVNQPSASASAPTQDRDNIFESLKNSYDLLNL